MPLQTAERLALQHQRDLATIAGATTSVVASVAMGADPATISTWYFGVVDGLLARIQAGHAQARLSSTQFLAKHAAMNGVDLTPVPASLNMERARTSLRVTGPVAFQTAMRAGQDEEQAIRSMATQMAGSSQRLVMAGDRDTFEQTLNAGKGVIGWRRRLAGRSCGFCAMLASRGAVYETRKSATQAKDGLAFHDHCNCWAEPMYKHETEPPEVRLLQRQWRNVTAGKRGNGAARAWRQHWEENVSPVERERLGMAAAKAAPSPIPGPPTPTPGVVVRPALDSRKTLSGLEQAWTAEARRITGRDLDVVIPAGTSLQTAKEYAEGVLRGMERFPDSALQRVRFGQMAGDHYAEAGGIDIEFNERWATIPNRPGLQQGIARDIEGWAQGVNGWGARGGGTTLAVALHEFGHIVDINDLGKRGATLGVIARHAAREGIGPDELVARDISVYATTHPKELVAEAFMDVMLRGQAASPVAREIFDLLEAEYFRAGGRITPSFGTFPAKAAPVALSRMTVPQLRALAKERGVTLPPKALKADIVRALEEGPSLPPKPPIAAAPALSKLKVADLRTMAAERQIPIPAKATKAELVRLVQSTPDEIKALQQKAIRDAAFARAKTGAEALRAAPVGLSHDAAQEPILSGLSKLSRAERDRIEHSVNLYATGSGGQLNDFLRAGRTMGDAETDALIGPFVRDIETALEHSPLRSDVLVWRGVDREILGDATRRDDLTGFEWIDPTFVSTSAVRREAEGFGNVLLRMVAPKGTPALRISDLAGEAELLLGPGSRFRVIRDLGMQDRSRPGSQMRVLDVEVIPHVVTDAERKAIAQRALRDAARERNRLIESSTGTARLLAEVDELISKGASKATILQRLDPKLVKPEQVFAGADPAIVDALRVALESGDTAKLRTALTRAGTKAKVKPISKAGVKVKFDPATMEALSGEIADGAQVVVVTRGSTLTLPDGSTMQLTKAKVAAVAKPLLKPLTRRELAIIEAKRNIPSLQAELRALPAGDPRRANVQYLLDNARAVIEQKPGPANYNWSSPSWDDPGGSRILRPPTAPELAKHIDDAISPVIPLGTRADLARELERQAELTPRSMLHFRGVEDPANFDLANHANSYAYYSSSFRWVSIKPDWTRTRTRTALEHSYAGDISSGWHPPTGAPSMLEAVLSHEYGHHVTYRLIEAPLVDQRRMIKLLDETFGLNGHLVREFRRDPDIKKVITDFVSGPYGVGRIDRAVSRYARKDYQEFFAEVWSEFTTMGDKARPQVKAIGEMMLRMAELSDVVLTP